MDIVYTTVGPFGANTTVEAAFGSGTKANYYVIKRNGDRFLANKSGDILYAVYNQSVREIMDKLHCGELGAIPGDGMYIPKEPIYHKKRPWRRIGQSIYTICMEHDDLRPSVLKKRIEIEGGTVDADGIIH